MKDHPDSELESIVHRELRKLPDVEAPARLVPRVMAVLNQRTDRRWWRGPWWAWPHMVRWPAAALAMAAVLACCGWPLLNGSVTGPWLGQASALLEPGREAWQQIMPVGQALVVLSQSLTGTPWLALAACVALALYMVCIGVGSIFVRFFLQPARAGARYEN